MTFDRDRAVVARRLAFSNLQKRDPIQLSVALATKHGRSKAAKSDGAPHRSAMTQHWEDMSHGHSSTYRSVAAVGKRAPSSTKAGSHREHHRHCNRVVRLLSLQHDDRAC